MMRYFVVYLFSLCFSGSRGFQVVSTKRTDAFSRRRVSVEASAAEVSIAATQQLLSLGVVAVAEGAWSTSYDGFSFEKALKYLGPTAATAIVLFLASGSVASGEAASMTPGLSASVIASFALCLHYGLRLKAKTPNAPPKEAIVLALALAFFGFSTAFQSLFAAGILQIPNLLPAIDTGLPSAFPDIRDSSSDSDSFATTAAVSAALSSSIVL